MSYNGSVFLPTQNVEIVQTDADLQALPSSSSVVGYPYLSEESGLYYFTNSLISVNSTDLVANDNGGVYKFYNPQSFLYLNNNNIITNLNFSFPVAQCYYSELITGTPGGTPAYSLQVNNSLFLATDTPIFSIQTCTLGNLPVYTNSVALNGQIVLYFGANTGLMTGRLMVFRNI